MENLTKEQLLELLSSGATTKKQSRKKTIQDDEKKEAMLAKLADMRKIVEQNRIKKKEAALQEKTTITPSPVNVVFEKQYSTQLEKMTDLLNDLNENTKELSKLKKEKLKKRDEDLVAKNNLAKEAEIVKEVSIVKEAPIMKEVPVVKEAPKIPISEPKPLVVQAKPSNFIPMYEAKPIPSPADILGLSVQPKIKPNRNMFRKNQLW